MGLRDAANQKQVERTFDYSKSEGNVDVFATADLEPGDN